MTGLFEFKWPRCPTGYQIIDTEDGRHLAPKSDETEWYDPWQLGFESRVLFMIFAETPKTPDGYLQRANAYGLLFGRDPEPLDVWHVRIETLRIAVQEWRDGGIGAVVDLFSGHRFGQVSLQMIEKTERGGARLRIAPDSLYDALWIQFGEAVAANLKIKSCIYCNTPFAFGPGTGKRNTARYCTSPCQKRHAYRKRSEAKS